MLGQFIMSPKVDYAFKELMRWEDPRVGFISSVFGIDPKEIKTTKILNPYLSKEHENEKQGILDVRVRMNDDTEINIEIQVLTFSAWRERSLFYLTKMYYEQINQGEDYKSAKRCVNISVLDFELFKDTEEYLSRFRLMEEKRHTLYTEKLELNILELPKMKSKNDMDNKLLAWGKFFNAESEEEFEEVAKTDNYIKSAYTYLKEMSADETKRVEYDERKKTLLDLKALKDDGISIGKKQGRAEGLAEGERIGIEKGERIGIEKGERIGIEKGERIGIEKGERIREQQIIEKMRAEGFTEEQIQLICGV